ncbi:BREX system serine/threonine kinase PglW [Nonomuraea sp. NPDC048892]|uniref:BREX system serine/threonine kinase PglW n=1 Tax=Nonomuraea sp. NPDC048892 TaxID=3154624 RepID=UPI0033EFFB77
MEEGRWTSITPSQFQHEREALEHVRELLPDAEPYRAWSNFTFTAYTGHVREVDLFVAAPSGLYLIEVKSLRGRLSASGANWVQTNGSHTRFFDNPLHLADSKAKQLRSLLGKVSGRTKIPYIHAAVFLSVPSLRVELPDHHLNGVFGPENGTLPKLWSELLKLPPDDDRRRIRPELSKPLNKWLHDIGIARSRSHLQIGTWELNPRSFDVGPTWEDHLAKHGQISEEKRRIRIYLVERNADETMRASIGRAARREVLALHGISHPGIVQVDTMEQHDLGPALIFRHDPRAMRLDHFIGEYGSRLDLLTRLNMIRQLAEAVSYAHGRHLHHRALSARSVLVTPGQAPKSAQEQGWLKPQLQISDWQTATRGKGSQDTGLKVSTTSHGGEHMEASAQAYLAPEVSAPKQDAVALDVFGLGTLAYLVLTGQPPSDKRAELLARLSKENGLRPSTVADSVTEFMDELVQAATAPVPTQRLTTVAEFIEMLELVEDEATAPESIHPSDEPQLKELDPLEARPGDVVGEWQVEKRLGTGSTSRALLVKNLRTGKQEVLKVALSDEKAIRLDHEAAVLRELRDDSRVIKLIRPEPVVLGNRSCLVLEHAGEQTVARKIREHGALTPDELETYSEYLFGAMDFLEGEGVTHRDIKPDNIAIRIRPNRTRQLVLFDFSLAGISVKEIEAGTPHYLDPFLGADGKRMVYDAHAERYALGVTLHEMASRELPEWGDGQTEPRYTEGMPTIAAEAFDASIRDGLVEFFQRALHRDAKKRFESLKEMRTAWFQVFRTSDASPPVRSDHPGELPAEDNTPDQARDAAAAVATRATALEASGLTLRAVSTAHRLDAVTVGDLLNLPSKNLFSLPGLGAKTRQELQRRIREWKQRLGETEPITSDEKAAARKEVAGAKKAGDEDAFSRIGLDTIAALLVPSLQPKARNATEVDTARLILGLPDDNGLLPGLPPWPQNAVVATAVGKTAGRVAQILGGLRKRWREDGTVRSVRDELIMLLTQSGRVMGVTELAEALLSRRGSDRGDPKVRRALALAAVRAAVEIDPTVREPRLLVRRHGNRLMLALEVSEDDSPDTAAAPALLDYADALGKVADRLADREVLPPSATVLKELSAVNGPAELEDRRLVELAAAASEHAAATSRLEIYPRDLEPIRALRLAQAGVIPVGGPGLTPAQVHERVHARFPALMPLPGHPQLDGLLADAGFDLLWRDGRYVPPQSPDTISGTVVRRRSTRTGASRWTAGTPELAEAIRAEERLTSAREGGFRALTVTMSRVESARRELISRFESRPVSVATLFLAALHELVDPQPLPKWETLLSADLAEPGSRGALKLAEYVRDAWPLVASHLETARAGGPLLLHDAGPMARYEGLGVLQRLAEQARSGGPAVWLLCPMPDAARTPNLDGALTPARLPNEWIKLPDAWVANQHRSGAQAS